MQDTLVGLYLDNLHLVPAGHVLYADILIEYFRHQVRLRGCDE